MSLELPYGIRVVNPVPIDFISGPYSANTENDAKTLANSSIPSGLRFKSLETRLIINGIPYKYWYKNGISDSDLVPFDIKDYDSTVVRTTGTQTINGVKTFSNIIQFNSGILVSGLNRFTIGAGGSSFTIDRGNLNPGNNGDALKFDVDNGNGQGYSTTLKSSAPPQDIIIKLPYNSGTLVLDNISVIAGSGLVGGGDLKFDRTLNIGQGDGISVSDDTISLNNTVVRTSGNQNISGIKTFTESICAGGNPSIGFTPPLLVQARSDSQSEPCMRIVSTGGVGQARNFFDMRSDGNLFIGHASPVGYSHRLTVQGTTADSTRGALSVVNSGNSSLMFVRNDGRVGIKTSTPAYVLDVLGTGNFSENLLVNGTGVVLSSRKIIPGSGLDGSLALDLSADRTFNIGKGDGILVGQNNISVDSSVVRTTGTQTINGKKTFIDVIVGEDVNSNGNPPLQVSLGMGANSTDSALIVAYGDPPEPTFVINANGSIRDTVTIGDTNTAGSLIINSYMGQGTFADIGGNGERAQFYGRVEVYGSTTTPSAYAPLVIGTSGANVAVISGVWRASTIDTNKGGTGQTSYSNGQLLIGSGTTLAKNTLTAGSNIQITNGSGSITIAATGLSISGHTHTASNITDFNSSVSGLLPTIANSGNNRILTSTGSSFGVNAESNATFDGTNFNISGVLNVDNLTLDNNTISSTNASINIDQGSANATIRLGEFLIIEKVASDQAMFGRNITYNFTDGWRTIDEIGSAAVRMHSDWDDASIGFYLHPTESPNTELIDWDGSDIKMVIRNNGFVGIGKNNPSYNLDVVGTGYFTQNLLISGVPVSLSGHTHSSNNITDFNTAVDSRISMSSAASSKTIAFFTAMHNQPPSGAFATLDTRNSIPVLNFDATSNESAVFMGVIPSNAVLSSGLVTKLWWMGASATAGNVVWSVQYENQGTDNDSDSFDVAASGTSSTNGTSGIETETSITTTDIDSLSINKRFRLKITRVANNVSDTMTGDAQLIAVETRMV